MKDAKGHGSEKRGGGMPIPGHDYHTKTDAQLRYIAKDASDAAKATRGMSMYDPNSHTRQDTEGKYLDQMNNAASVLGYRARGGTDYSPDGAAARELARGNPKADAAPVHPGASGPQYNREAVNNAIASSNRAGRRIGGREAGMIHALLKGRH